MVGLQNIGCFLRLTKRQVPYLTSVYLETRYITLTNLKVRENGKTGNKKRATCFATLLQNELSSDVTRFTTHVQTC